MTSLSIHSPVGQSEELSSILTSTSYWGEGRGKSHVDVRRVHRLLHSLQLLHHLIDPEKELSGVFAKFYFHGIEIDGVAVPFL